MAPSHGSKRLERACAAPRRAPVALALLTCCLFALPSGVRAGPTKVAPDAPDALDAHSHRVGPVQIRDDIRRRVRGDRPPGASVHLAFAFREHRPNPQLWRALLEFEDTHLGERAALPKTIVDEAPEAWMQRLVLPDFDVRWNARLVEYLRYFKEDPKGQALAHAWLRKLQRYETRIRPMLEEAGVPGDMILVAAIESGLDPRAQSSVGAGGMWQFMEPTARVYGLRGDYWRDERFDFERSAYAAGAYLADLRARFGTWELALAAYNAGYGLVVQTIRQNNSNNFWALAEIENALPLQTKNYVPKIIAAAIVAENPEVFGYVAKPDGESWNWIEVQVPGGTRLDDVAKAIKVDASELRELNAHWIRGRTNPELNKTMLRIPKSQLERFEAAPQKLRSPEQALQSYKMRLGEHLDEVAAAHGLSGKELRRLNGVQDSGELGLGVVLALPPKVSDKAREALLPSTRKIVGAPLLEAPKGKELIFFRVTRASTPRRISRGFGVEWDRVVAWNDLDPKARLVDGQMLQLVVPKDFDAAARQIRVYRSDEVVYVARGSEDHLEALLEDRGLQRRQYEVKKGDTLARVAKRFNLSTGSLARINNVMRGHRVAEGDKLLVYVEKGKTRGTGRPPAPDPTTLGFETLVLGGEDDLGASTAASAKLPGQDRKLNTRASEIIEDVDDAGPKSRAPSTAAESRLPGARTP